MKICKKLVLWNFFFILLPFKNVKYFTIDNLLTYGHITLKFVHFFTGLLQYLPKNTAILVQKLGVEKNVKIRSRLFYD